ncbi:MAG: Peptidoglycan-binding domain 1 protein [Capsulimonas sp.]|nr:Peptidoglycan-binding domain 1 protein [Capsulimonas sp.]
MANVKLSAAEKAARQQAVIARAIEYLGTKEEPPGSNRGREVDRFLLAANCAPGNPWCMAFVYAMFSWSGYTSANGVTLLFPTASCQVQADHAKANGLLVSADDARTQLAPGWVMLKWEPSLVRYAHAGIVTAYDRPTGVFKTIEGNTNTDGGREGYEVARQTRKIGDTGGGRAKYAFIRTA